MENFVSNDGNLQDSDVTDSEASIKLSNPLESSRSCQVKAIVDTGISMTCIPESVIVDLGKLLVYSRVKVRDANGNIRTAKTYMIDVAIADDKGQYKYLYCNIEVVAIPKEYGLIGRDILNKHSVTLNSSSEFLKFLFLYKDNNSSRFEITEFGVFSGKNLQRKPIIESEMDSLSRQYAYNKLFVVINWILVGIFIISFIIILIAALFLNNEKAVDIIIIQNIFSLTLGWFGSSLLIYLGKKDI
ncbi:Retroviral aspartyl protease [Xenococcus sp. PCC 7305]|uniref:retropepsin-like aspartic protease n=1 Tax=Xenococcus sp. PCC 7305 TaxID=102125 RepID=UPI0002AD0A76|nr:retropepsin-like aspartic protease [Xenococcus sp. PCC 7305]ELS03983.1 Retroviral aspartyl protease [Xenococcus sp. PCC 7305]